MELNCEETYRRLQHYLDRELSQVEIAAVEAHLANCGICAEEFRFEASVIHHIRKVWADALPAELASSVKAALDRETA